MTKEKAIKDQDINQIELDEKEEVVQDSVVVKVPEASKVSSEGSSEKEIAGNFIIETKKASVFYGNTQAIKNVDIGIKKNTVTAFIGPSGCGKSTFLRLFNRMNDYIESFRISQNHI